MDTTKLELQAENYVNSILTQHDFLVSKPQYDSNGCDLQILDNSSFPTRLLRIQSKGRTIDKRTLIEVSKDYVDNNFILFIYTIDSFKKIYLYIFFPEEIKHFTSHKNNYRLIINPNSFSRNYESNIFTKLKADELKIRLHSAKIKEETTVLIDAFCLENALKSTLRMYKEIYPEKFFSLPNVLDVIKQIVLFYDKLILANRIINAYIFLTPYNFIETKFYDSEDLYIGKNKIRIFEMRIDGFVSFEIEDYLNRVVNSENIILVATDNKYVPLLNALKMENKEIVLVCEKLDNSIRDFGFKWGDITYPIAIAMGISKSEI